MRKLVLIVAFLISLYYSSKAQESIISVVDDSVYVETIGTDADSVVLYYTYDINKSNKLLYSTNITHTGFRPECEIIGFVKEYHIDTLVSPFWDKVIEKWEKTSYRILTNILIEKPDGPRIEMLAEQLTIGQNTLNFNFNSKKLRVSVVSPSGYWVANRTFQGVENQITIASLPVTFSTPGLYHVFITGDYPTGCVLQIKRTYQVMVN